MPATVSIEHQRFGSANMASPADIFAWVGSATTPEVMELGEMAARLGNTFEHSQALFGPKSSAIAELVSLFMECAQDDWDGAGAHAISVDALHEAAALILALPEVVPLPEFAPEPDGSISLDWMVSRNRLFSLSASGTGRIAYAWLDGADSGHAVARFNQYRVPDRILYGIAAILGPNFR